LFTEELSSLKQVVSAEQALLNNLTEIGQLYSTYHSAGVDLFNSNKLSIEQKDLLIDKVDVLEEKADDAVMILLDLSDHDLADTDLQRAISLSEHLENQFNSIVSSAFEYRDILDETTAQLIQSELTRNINDAQLSVEDIIVELNYHGIQEVSQQVNLAFKEMKDLLSENGGILDNKATQLSANVKASAMLLKEKKYC
jgi:methyl-accepting chemotaxis protein